jgi:hypothetical protein
LEALPLAERVHYIYGSLGVEVYQQLGEAKSKAFEMD